MLAWANSLDIHRLDKYGAEREANNHAPLRPSDSLEGCAVLGSYGQDYLPTVRTVGLASTLGWLLLEPGATQASTFTQTAPYLDGQMPS
jgi:hypothetical protein